MKNLLKLLFTFFLLNLSFFSPSLFTQQLVDSDYLKWDEMRAQLSSVSKDGQTIIELPNHMDVWRQYVATESNILSEDFRAKRPDVRTFRIVDQDNPYIRGRLAITKNDMHALMITPFGTIYIENAGRADADQYYIYLNDNPLREGDQPLLRPSCVGAEKAPEYQEPMRRFNMRNNDVLEFGSIIRKYNLAVVTTGEFYLGNGESILTAEDAVIFSVNAMQAIFEVDMGVNFVLLPPFIYDNPDTDPFDPNGPGLTVQAANAVDMNFDIQDYDIGHVFHNNIDPGFATGGVAGLGVVCREFLWSGGPGVAKGAGWSSGNNNTGNFWIRLLTHEVGHMFNANHTFNGAGGFCNGGNFSPNTNYEIGSGTTIMSYGGLCGAGQNVPSSGVADNYFHANSLESMIDYILDLGDCHDDEDIGNTPPVAEADPCGLMNYSIPTGTPFKIIGDGSDVDGDPLSFVWEQYDNDGPSGPTQGLIGAAAAANPLAPLFRSFPPSSSATRYFPSKSLILDGIFDSSFEPLPTVERDLTFRLSVRDGNGGLGMDVISISVEDTGPFDITFPNGSENLNAGDNIAVTWSVNGTDAFCDDVNIYLSVDGGLTFPYQIGESLSNNGSANVDLPPGLPNTNNARVKVACADNPCVVFFTISADNFEIESDCEAPNTTISSDDAASFSEGDPDLNLDLENNLGSIVTNFEGTITTDDEAGNLVFIDNNSPPQCGTGSNPTHYHVHTFSVDVSGFYTISHGGPFGTVLNLYSDPFQGTNCTNHISSSGEFDGGAVILTPSLDANLEAGMLYVLMVSSFNDDPSNQLPTYPFDYNITFSSPPMANIYDGVALPPDYTYTYIAVNSGGIIVLEDEDSDFTALSPGNYEIYGVAYYSGAGPDPSPTDPADWINEPLFDVIGIECAVLSDNFKPLEVTGCDASFEYEGVSSLEDPPFNTVEFCQNESNPSPVVIGELGGEFSVNNSNIAINSTSGEIDLSSSLVGTYIVTYEITSGDGCEESIEVIIHASPSVNASNGGPYCEGETIALSASGGTSYSWEGPDNFSSPDQNPTIPNATLAMDGIYSVTVTDANSCE
ncbi:MAG: hypothetical protein EA409_07335, partial [Saprospirales bacterium]